MRVAGSGLDSTAHSKPGQLMTILCKVDGLCESAFEGGPQNPGGVATYGYVICYEDGRLIAKGSGVVGEGEGMDHMVAEYEAVVRALIYLISENRMLDPVEVHNDNRQLLLEMEGKKEILKGLHGSRHHQARELTFRFSNIQFKWIAGDLNWEADCLAWKEYRGYVSEKRRII